MTNERYSIRFDKESKKFDVYLSGFEPMYCGTFDTKEEAKIAIKEWKENKI